MNSNSFVHKYMFILVIFVLLLLESVFSLYWTNFPSSDMYYHLSVSESVMLNGEFPLFDRSIVPQRVHTYPPLIPVFTAYLSQLSGVPLYWFVKLFPFILLPLFFVVSFRLLGFFVVDSRVQLLASLLFVTNANIAFQYASIYAGPSFGILFSLICLYLFLGLYKKKKIAYFIAFSVSSALLLLLHTRSFISTYLILFAFVLADYVRNRQKRIDRWKVYSVFIGFFISILFALPWAIPRLDSLVSTYFSKNPFIDSYVLSVFGYFILPTALVFFVVFFRSLKSLKSRLFLLMWLVVPIFSSLFQFYNGVTTFYRELEYVGLVIFLLISVVLVGFIDRINRYSSKMFVFWGIVLVGFVLLQSLSILFAPPVLYPGEFEALSWAGSHIVQDDSVFLASFKHNYAIPAISGHKVVVGAFPESLSDSNKRLNDLHSFFLSCDSDERNRILKEYSVDYIFFGVGERNIMRCPDYLRSGIFDKVYDSAGVIIFRVNQTKYAKLNQTRYAGVNQTRYAR